VGFPFDWPRNYYTLSAAFSSISGSLPDHVPGSSDGNRQGEMLPFKNSKLEPPEVGMRAVVQRVKEAWVKVSQEEVARIGQGLLVLAGVAADDGPADVDYLAQKLAHLRVFPGAERLLNLSLLDTGFEVLLVSQFTILGDCRKGRRPSFDAAASPELAERLYQELAARLSGHALRVSTGRFRQMMEVGLINDGPVTVLLDSKKIF
jgi:D-tyrosyl-tRNA(Tyr) deacylase